MRLASSLRIALVAALVAASALADDTILLVNDNYINGLETDLGYKGYASFPAAQAAVWDKDSTTIMATVEDTEVEPPSFTEDIVTKDFRTKFVGTDGDRLDLGHVDVDTKYVSGSVGNANWMLRIYVGYEF